MAHAELRGVVALDGPSGTGKSTVARKLAAALSASYLDTGAMYRAVTLAVLRAEVPVADEAAVAEVAASALPVMGTNPLLPTVTLAGEDVGQEIRGAAVTGAVSAVSAVARVRELLVDEQRRLIREALGEPGGVVVEGRDIGTVVARDAELKVYLTASSQARARRRSDQDSAAGRVSDLESTHADVQRRDAFDSGRAVSPLRMADDAVELDTTELDVAGVLEQLRTLVDTRGLFAGVESTR
ncbi:(d)CMP kinase [Saccharopolyspora sp. NFXS83]|uniref:(d)CMP kinase n=1 Tax=Saccharopolyspora sp. NFXS83 TaxID=2993560 RepID=UPI00224AD911|nr:(d)CMP kinase [Saccharopolyspora sp. NFXS83]MCX2733012.1 (d)CMP kinase [Saccharopolyspora sp. NFXS83]